MKKIFNLDDENLNSELILLKNLIDSSSDLFIITDENGNLIYINRKTSEKLGYLKDELLNMNISDIDLKCNKYKCARNLKYLKKYNNLSIKTTHTKKDNTTYVAEVDISIINFKGQTYFLEIARDITEKESQEKKLHLAKEKAESANRAKSIFLSNMSHELRTPMNSVIGYAELLKTTKLNTKQKNYIQQLSDSGNYMIHLINDILDISKIEAEQIELHKSEFLIYDLVKFIKNNFRIQAKKKEINFSIEHNLKQDSSIIGDKAKLFQILLNLVGNSLKFTKDGFVKIVILKKEIDNYYFEVNDSGIGIKKSELKNIFNIFYKTKETSHQGTGLGLAISKKNVELMGGVLSVSSQQNRGTKFFFTLKLDPSLNIKSKKIEIIYENSNKKILIVDDEKANIEMLNTILKNNDFKVYSANNGYKALDMYKKEKPDVILMDIIMPEIDGVKSAKIIKEYDLNANIIAMTAQVFSKKISEDIFNDVVFKPFRFNLLIDKIQISLKKTSKEMEICSNIETNLKNNIFQNAQIGNYTQLKKLIKSLKNSKCREYLLKLLNEFNIEEIIKILSNKIFNKD